MTRVRLSFLAVFLTNVFYPMSARADFVCYADGILKGGQVDGIRVRVHTLPSDNLASPQDELIYFKNVLKKQNNIIVNGNIRCTRRETFEMAIIR